MRGRMISLTSLPPKLKIPSSSSFSSLVCTSLISNAFDRSSIEMSSACLVTILFTMNVLRSITLDSGLKSF